MRLALFDLDNTLLVGDSDVLWCDFLIGNGLLDAAAFAAANADMDRRYRAGTVGAREFVDFYVSTLRGRSRSALEPVRKEFLARCILPRIPHAARSLIDTHRADDTILVLTTATNRFITELTAKDLAIANLIASEAEERDGVFTGRATGTVNMREGKVERLHAWLADEGLSFSAFEQTWFYSDSVNDLPLLSVVSDPVVVNPDERLARVATERGWPALGLGTA